jgi:hypothetical protein
VKFFHNVRRTGPWTFRNSRVQQYSTHMMEEAHSVDRSPPKRPRLDRGVSRELGHLLPDDVAVLKHLAVQLFEELRRAARSRTH